MPVGAIAGAGIASAGASIFGATQAADAQTKAARQAGKALSGASKTAGSIIQSGTNRAIDFTKGLYTSTKGELGDLVSGAGENLRGLYSGTKGELANLYSGAQSGARNIFDEGRAGVNNIYSGARDAMTAAYQGSASALTPYMGFGQQAGQMLMDRLPEIAQGQFESWAPTQEWLEGTPGYQFALQQGQKAVTNSASAKGLGSSGQAMRGAADYAQGLASQTYGQQFDIYNQRFQNWLARNAQEAGMYLAPMGIGEQAAGKYGALGVQHGANLGALAQSQGNVLAGLSSNEASIVESLARAYGINLGSLTQAQAQQLAQLAAQQGVNITSLSNNLGSQVGQNIITGAVGGANALLGMGQAQAGAQIGTANAQAGMWNTIGPAAGNALTGAAGAYAMSPFYDQMWGANSGSVGNMTMDPSLPWLNPSGGGNAYTAPTGPQMPYGTSQFPGWGF